MSKVDFGADVAAAEKEFNIGKGSDKFKFKEGDNRIRVLSSSAALQNTYTDPKSGEKSTNVKFCTWVWDYAAQALKLAFFPYTIVKAIAGLQATPDYAFSEVPMPYDLNVQAKNAGTKEVEYSVIPARNNSDVPKEALDALAKEKPIDEVRDLIHAQQAPAASSELPV